VTKGKKIALIILATAPIGFAIFSFLFMVKSEMAFDEAVCPYAEIETREITSGIRVREDGRTCEPGVVEHRWVLLQDGEEDLAIGQRRLLAELYEGYSWSARVEEERVRLEILNPGQDPRVFRSPSPDAGMPRL